MTETVYARVAIPWIEINYVTFTASKVTILATGRQTCLEFIVRGVFHKVEKHAESAIFLPYSN